MEEKKEDQTPQNDLEKEELKKMIPLDKATAYISWIKEKLELDYIAESVKNMSLFRGQVYWCKFGMGVGYEIQKRRPAVIVQCNLTNKWNGNTIVVPITHNNSHRISMIPISTRYTDDGKTVILDGQADATQVTRINKARVDDYICDLTQDEMKLVDAAIARELNLMHYYVDEKKKLVDKTNYSEKVVKERNKAQDELKEIRSILGVGDDVDLFSCVKILKESIDKKEN
jgi:mRNA interferase MazF|nr:MAG TPA: PemK-like protein [Bacteriophage sp.]